MTAVSIEDVIERVRAAAGAEFAFVLTMRGRLVTQRAPRDMPEVGRTRLVTAGRSLPPRTVERLTLPRDALVPYGGAAPVDVYFAVAAERAVVCVVVMSGWRYGRRVRSAIEVCLDEIEPKVASAFDSRVVSRGTAELPPSTRKEPATTGSEPPPNPQATTKRRRDQGASTVKASPRALDRSSLGAPHSVPVPPASIARFVATEEAPPPMSFDRPWTDHRVLEEIDSDAREASEPLSATAPPTARRESFPPIDSSIESGQATRKSISPKVTVELADADDELLEAVRSEARPTKPRATTQTEAAPRKKEGSDSIPETQRVPEPEPLKPS